MTDNHAPKSTIIPKNNIDNKEVNMTINNIPDELKNNGLFCFWKRKLKGDSFTKVPYRADHNNACCNNRNDFVSFDTAVRYAKYFDGIGLGLFDGWCAIDIDHCLKDGILSDLAKEIINTMDSYTEISPSGKGIRIIFRADDFIFDKCKYRMMKHELGLEVYISGATNKYVTLTGNRLHGSCVQERSKEVAAILDKYMQQDNKRKYPVSADTARKAPHEQSPTAADSASRTITDDEINRIVAKISASPKGEKFLNLWNGIYSASASQADLSFCDTIVFECHGDTALMYELVKKSKLYRDKWEREDYRTNTMQKAVNYYLRTTAG